MTKEQILQLLTDYCRTMLYAGKTLPEVESFLHVLRNYLQHQEFMRIFRNLKKLEATLAYAPVLSSFDTNQQRRLGRTAYLLAFMGLGLLLVIFFHITGDTMAGNIMLYAVITCSFFVYRPLRINWVRKRQTSRLNHQQNIPEPEKVVIDFIEFFEEEARRRREEMEG